MSYILEALKKAQAERQLGSAPDIHTPAPSHVPAPAAGASRKPLLIGLSAGIVIAGIAGVLAWRSQAPAPQVAVLASTAQGTGGVAVPAPAVSTDAAAQAPSLAAGAPTSVATAPAPTSAPAADTLAASPSAPAPAAGAPTASPGAAVSAPAPRELPAQAPRQAANAGTAAEAASAARPASTPPAGDAARSRPSTQPEGRAAPAARNTPAPASVATSSPDAVYLPAPAARASDPAPVARAPEPAEENLRTLQQLPEAIQREVPRVIVGGYIYSPNPADRLLLVDKMLRREGEELAPGLVLERLMPKYAVMNYRGTRYRVGY